MSHVHSEQHRTDEMYHLSSPPPSPLPVFSPRLVQGPSAWLPRSDPLSSLSVLIQSSTKLCSFDFLKVSRIPLFLPSPPPLLMQAPITSQLTAAWVFHLFTLPSDTIPSKLPSHYHRAVPSKIQLRPCHLPGKMP